MLASALALALSIPILACPEPIAASPTAAALRAEMPFRAAVVGDSVNVRSGPGSAYDVVIQLAGGSEVEVLGEAFGWLLIRPAAEVRVYVSRDLVEPKGDGIAAVSRDRVNVRSRPRIDATVVGQANRGDLVRLIDADGDFVAIAAPPETAFYVHRDLVRRAPEGTVKAAAAAPAPGGPVGASPAAPGGAGAKAVRAREIYLAEMEKPDLDAMDFAEAERLFGEALKEASGDDVRAIAGAGLRRVRAAVALQEDYRRRVGPIERMLDGPGAGKK